MAGADHCGWPGILIRRLKSVRPSETYSVSKAGPPQHRLSAGPLGVGSQRVTELADSGVLKPPDGNVISGNGANGVLLTNGASHNQLSGNFIGVELNGTAGLGNALDGVAIVGANNNSVLGTDDLHKPFVYFNVVSGNGGNGLRVDNSNNTVVEANYFGLGADNQTPLGNSLDGVLIEGTSDGTQFGLNIPLGNASAANGENGVEIRDTAQNTLVENTFAGVAAFNSATAVGNHLDGMLVTSTGGNNLLLTNQASGNGADGIEIGGNATGVQVSQTFVGLATNGEAAQPNAGNGIEIDGNASGNLIGGFQPSVAPGATSFPAMVRTVWLSTAPRTTTR